MSIVFRKFHRLILGCLIFFFYPSYGQSWLRDFSRVIDSAGTIVVGRVEKSVVLNTSPGMIIDGWIFSISVNRVLKGESGVDSLDLITYKGDGCGGTHLRSVGPLYTRKTYLLFLDTARVDSALIVKYNLQGRNFYAAVYCGDGVYDLYDQKGVNRLRQTEDSLNIPPTTLEIVSLTGWIDSLGVILGRALTDGLIGDSTFVEALHGVLNNAQNLLLQGDSTNCSRELLKFDKMIKGAFAGFDRIRSVEGDLYSTLSSDVLYLHSKLPNVPWGYESFPLVDSLSPSKAEAGGPGFTMAISGEDFENGATVYWNWSPRTTTFVSSTQIQATITSQDIANTDTATVAVVNPGGGTHGATFIVVRTFTLAVTAFGNGTITKNPNQATYDSASTVQLTAIPASGYYFIEWGGDTSGSTNPILVTMNNNKSITATFKNDAELAAENKSSSWDATATNNARHLAKSGNYLHEVFISGGELFYRRSMDGGSTWDQTHQINTAVGENAHPCITTTESGTLQIVWQRKIAPTQYGVWHSHSQDNGESWSTPATLPDAGTVEVSEYQTEGTMPVIAERKKNNLVAIYCSSEGLRYRISGDDGETWEITGEDIISGQYNDRVRFPSLAGRGGQMYLLYDYVDDEMSPYSRTFDGSTWSTEVSISEETGTVSGAFSSVAIDVDKNPIASWSADHTWSRSIVFRAGNMNNTWSGWFAEFWGGQLSPDWLNPSLTYYNRELQYGVAIVHPTAQNLIKLIRYVENVVEAPYWDIITPSESGAWANITHDNYDSGEPIYCWSGQGSFPHDVVVGSLPELSPLRGRTPSKSGATKLTNVGVTQKRRAVVHHRSLRATLSLEFEPMKIVTTGGDTTLAAFKPSSLREQGINLVNMWDYLGSAVVSLPTNARRLVLSKQFTQRGPSIAQRKFFFRVLNTNGIPLRVLDTTATSGTVSVNIAPYAGREVILRPQVVLVGIDPPSVKIGVGDVFIAPDTQSKPVRQKKK